MFSLHRSLPIACALTAVYATSGVAQRVASRDGSIIFIDRANVTHSLTSSGLDAMPTLSPDTRHVAFVRHTPADSVETSLGAAERTELWIVGVDGTGLRRLVRGHGGPAPERTLAGMENPQFSPDGRVVYVQSDAWVTSGALHAVQLSTGAERFVCASNRFEVVQHGKYRGDLRVTQHRHGAGGSFDASYIVTPAGRTLTGALPDR